MQNLKRTNSLPWPSISGAQAGVPPHSAKLGASLDVAEVLCDASLYGDGPPLWDNCTSSATAEKQRQSLCKRLRRFRYLRDGAAEVEASLAHCQPPNGNCRSAACILCGRAFQRFVVRQGNSLFASAGKENLYLLTVVPEAAQAQIGALGSHDLSAVTSGFASAMKSVDDVRFLAGWDISLNDERQRGNGKFWQPHLHAVVETSHQKALKGALSKQFASERIHRPVQFQPNFDGSNRGFSYPFKVGHFEKKVFYRSSIDNTWKVKPNRFSASEEVELYLWLSAVGLSNRLICSDDIYGGAA